MLSGWAGSTSNQAGFNPALLGKKSSARMTLRPLSIDEGNRMSMSSVLRTKPLSRTAWPPTNTYCTPSSAKRRKRRSSWSGWAMFVLRCVEPAGYGYHACIVLCIALGVAEASHTPGCLHRVGQHAIEHPATLPRLLRRQRGSIQAPVFVSNDAHSREYRKFKGCLNA